MAPAIRATPVTDIEVDFSSPIESSTFTTTDLSLTYNGGANLITAGSGVTITNISGGAYDVSLPSGLTTGTGTYNFTVSAAGTGILDASGNPVVGGDFTDWTVAGFQEVQSPRNIVVQTLTVTFATAINPATFTASSLSLTRRIGGLTTGNLLDSRVTITPDTDPLALPNTYVIGSLSFPQAIAGTYTLSINGPIDDPEGDQVPIPASVSWVLDLTVPAAPSNLAISPDEGPDPLDGELSELTNSQTVTFSGTVDANTVEVRLQDLTTSTYLGDAFLNGQTFSRTLTLSPGLHELSAQAFDLAANGSPVSTYYVFVDMAPPTVNNMAPIVPNPATTPVDTELVVLNKTVKTFDWTALSLTLGGVTIPLNSSVTVTPVAGAAMPTYEIAGLAQFTMKSGIYILSVNADQIVDYANNAGIGGASVSWTETRTVADATITNTVNNANPHEGSVIHFTVTVANAGPAIATNVSILDLLPSGLTLEQAASSAGGSYDTSTGVWSIAQIDVNSSATLTLTASVNIGTIDQTISNTATITQLDQNNSNGINNSASASASVRMIATQVAISGANPRNTPVGTAASPLEVTFSDPVASGSINPAALTLTDNGTNVPIGGGITLTPVTGDTYAIGGLATLTVAEGAYVLTVNAADIPDQGGLTGTGTVSTSWLTDTAPPISKVSPLPARGTSLGFPISVTGSDPAGPGNSPASGVASYTIFVQINGGTWSPWTTVPASNPTATYTGASNTTYSFYSLARDNAGNVESKAPAIEASTYLPDLTPPVTTVDATTGTNPSTVNSTTGTFTLDLTGSDPGGAALTYFEVFVSIDGGAYQEVGPYAISAGFSDSHGNYHSTIAYQGFTDGQPHNYSFYSIGLDSAGNLQGAPNNPNVTFSNEQFTAAAPVQLQVSSFTVEHGSPSRSFIQFLDLGFNESDSQSDQELTTIINSVGTASPDITIYKYDLNGDASSKTAVPLSSPTMLSVLDHAIEINFGSGGIGNSPTSTAADGYYEVDIKLPSGQTAVHHFDRLLGDVAGDGIVDQNDLNEIAASIGETSQMGWAPLSASVTGDGTVSSLDLLLATRSKNRKLGSGLALG